ncbi:deleted in malignant brain tumors 1 protein-like isoform X2 [Kryptolebias marmoratus]|uniref:deleted in malignant brain tumors 1 protein-like isoform X2 n=1 Tax=Kryptolebias marmoratus TaxID=37003 RepID=UPI0018ACF31B|nr:deleted in malignant brain tumors 1 protein-like isoform X2 [Kryptolebias marmoratus]
MKTQASVNQTLNSNVSFGTFYIPQASKEDEGLYQCQVIKMVSNETFSTFISDPINLTLTDAQIRLVGPSQCSGRVEIFYNDEWGTVCDDDWDLEDAQVVCRQLGCGAALDAPHVAYFGQGANRIWLDNVGCTGSETYLTNCSHNGFGIHNCGHGEDAGVICSANLKPNITISPEGVIINRQPVNITCSIYERPIEGSVIFMKTQASVNQTLNSNVSFGTFYIPQASKEDEGLYQCQVIKMVSNETFSTFISDPINLTLTDAQIRLVGPSQCSGRVEIFYNDEWGTVCDDDWDLEDAQVVCRQLGCGAALDAPHVAYFGQGANRIWLDNVGCTGSETHLTNCSHNGFGIHNCGHGEDAGVICSANLKPNITISPEGVIINRQPVNITCSIYERQIEGSVIFMKTQASVNQTLNPNVSFGTFYIPQASKEDEGLYQCQVLKIVSNETFSTFISDPINLTLTDAQIRLVGPSQCSGRVEIFYNDEWGTVCDDDWDLEDAQVVCRQLGCGAALDAPHVAYFGQGANRIWLDNVGCTGSETHLTNCSHNGFGIHNCGHGEDAGVICSGAQIRLVGPSQCSGRVEIFYNDEWGTVCDDDWDLEDAQVVCRQLGCGAALDAPHVAYFGQGANRIWLDNVGCTGSETHLTNCSHNGFGIHNCGHGEDAGVICSGAQIRLVGPSQCSGRVEIFYNDEWGTVCDDDWDLEDAQVVCRQLGCGAALDAPHVAYFGQGANRIWLDNVGCTGSETHLTNCSHNGFGIHNCGHGEDAGVICSANLKPNITISPEGVIINRQPVNITCSIYERPIEGSVIFMKTQASVNQTLNPNVSFGTFYIPQASKEDEGLYQCQVIKIVSNETFSTFISDPINLTLTDAQIRLVGPSQCSGRVEIFYNDEWGTVCDDDWDLEDAQVVCRQLGCGAALDAPHVAYFGQGANRIWLDNVGCTGSETHLTNCSHNGFGIHNCGHGEDAGVICSDYSVRLVGSNQACSGRIEIYYKATWGTVCDDGWDTNDAEVVCRQLGCGPALGAPSKAYFGEGTGQIWLDDVACLGNESSLSKCFHSGFGTHNCEHHQDVGVTCEDGLHIRLAGSNQTCSGRIEIFYKNTWGTVCDNLWDTNSFNAEVACRQLSCGPALATYSLARYGEGTGPIWLSDVTCSGNESSLNDCRHIEFGENNCIHNEDVSVSCLGTQIRLVGPSRCSGRVEIFYNDEWGTVCDDDWDLEDAQVVCRQLGCGAALDAPHFAYFGQGANRIWLDNVGCTGSETYLTNCSHNGFGIHNCGHGEDAGVICSANLKPNITISPEGVIINRQPVNITCSIYERPIEGSVIFMKTQASVNQTLNPNVSFGTFYIPQASKEDEGSYQCQVKKIVSNKTFSTFISDPITLKVSDFSLRLVGSNQACSGRIEIYYKATWGAVCDDGWDTNDAEVVCRQLGCGPALGAPSKAYFGEGTGQIWLDDVACLGNESSLFECFHNGFGTHNCEHHQDVGVTCKANSAPAGLPLVWLAWISLLLSLVSSQTNL